MIVQMTLQRAHTWGQSASFLSGHCFMTTDCVVIKPAKKVNRPSSRFVGAGRNQSRDKRECWTSRWNWMAKLQIDQEIQLANPIPDSLGCVRLGPLSLVRDLLENTTFTLNHDMMFLKDAFKLFPVFVVPVPTISKQRCIIAACEMVMKLNRQCKYLMTE